MLNYLLQELVSQKKSKINNPEEAFEVGTKTTFEEKFEKKVESVDKTIQTDEMSKREIKAQEKEAEKVAVTAVKTKGEAVDYRPYNQ